LASWRPAWHADASCRGKGPDAWFPTDRTRASAEVVEVCGACPVRGECLDAGMSEVYGVWDGVSREDRIELRRQAGVNLKGRGAAVV
jgi:hypothetical protein